MLEDGCHVALEIVLPDEDAKKIWVAKGAEHVPRQCRPAKYSDHERVQEANRSAPLPGERGPKERRAACENDGGRTFREHCGAKEKSERNAKDWSWPGFLQHFASHSHRG